MLLKTSVGNDAQNINEDSGVKIEGIYKKVMSGVLSKLAGGGGSENDNKHTMIFQRPKRHPPSIFSTS